MSAILIPQDSSAQWLTFDAKNLIKQGTKLAKMKALFKDIRDMRSFAEDTRAEFEAARDSYRQLQGTVNALPYIDTPKSEVTEHVVWLRSKDGIHPTMTSKDFMGIFPMNEVPEDRQASVVARNKKMMTTVTETMAVLRLHEQELIKANETASELGRKLQRARSLQDVRLVQSHIEVLRAHQKTLRDMVRLQSTNLKVIKQAEKLSDESISHAQHEATMSYLRGTLNSNH